ncbi:MAG: hypothetical protein ACR2N2_06390, partial [Acidimicrobiia bacterium]
VVIVVVQIIIAGRAPTEAGVEDERDTLISHRGDRVGAAVLSAGIAVTLVITWFEAEYFWIASAIFAAFILQALSAMTIKVASYRGGM